ncbi:MAG: hypothetical protein ABSA96_20855, partial [Candidatus Acidiferrales bacterium]
QPNLQKKQNQENSRSSFPFSFSPCSLIKSTKTVSEMLARREMHARIMRGLRSSIFFSDTRIGEEDFAQLLNSLRPSISSSELIFLHTVREQGLRRAAFLAAIFQWQFQRPLKALLGMTDARGRSYTKAKRKAKDALKRCEVRG